MKMTVEDVARISGISAYTLRAGAVLGKFPFMTAFKTGDERYTYVVFPKKVREYFDEEGD